MPTAGIYRRETELPNFRRRSTDCCASRPRHAKSNAALEHLIALFKQELASQLLGFQEARSLTLRISVAS
jgi:hypothetical protein